MWNQVKVLQIGCGKLAKYTMKSVFDHGGSVVAAISDDPSLIGKDIGIVIDGGIKGPVIYSYDQLDRVLKACNPEVAIIESDLSLKDIKDLIIKCLSYGVNVITNCEDVIMAEITNPSTYKEIDKIAKQNNCTIFGCGYIDNILSNLTNLLCASSINIKSIKILLNTNVLDKSMEYIRRSGIGLNDFTYIKRNNEKTFKEIIDLLNKEEYNPSNVWIAINWLVKKLSLNITSINQIIDPIILDTDLVLPDKGINLPKGYSIGIKKEVTAETKEGIKFNYMNEEKVFNETDKSFLGIYIDGNPSSSLNINNPDIIQYSASNLVNKIPSIIDSNPGFINTTKTEEAYYFVGTIDKYIDPSKRKK